jgi:predicted flavoprotein YhiN
VKLIPVFIELTRVSGEKPLAEVSGAERKRLRLLLKNFSMDIQRCQSIDHAIITAGGVSVVEINSQTMESRLVKGLHFAGEVMDVDADTGGYNLQAAFSTGWVAGRAASIEK